MGNCYPDSEERKTQLLLIENELKLTLEFRKTIEDIYFKNVKQKKLRTDEEIMQGYKLMGELGSGYFSKVYLVSDSQGKLYALKVVQKQKFKSKENIQKILVEKLILKVLKHDNILRLFKTIQSKKNLYFFIEYASKGNLLSILNQKYKLQENQIRIIAAQMIKGLLYIHSQGIIYGDLKAENILINENGIVKFCDFNLAGTKSFLDDQIQGTQSYLAPEIIEKKPRTKKSDFWALGVLLYLLNYRCYPFVGKSQTDLFYNIVNRNFNEKTKYKGSGNLKSLLSDLFRKDINRRLGNNLQEFIHHPFFKDFQWGNDVTLDKSFLQSIQTIDQQLDEIRQSNPESAQIPSLNNKFLYEIEGFTYESENLEDQNLEEQIDNQFTKIIYIIIIQYKN